MLYAHLLRWGITTTEQVEAIFKRGIVSVPVIACGGIGSLGDCVKAVDCGASAAAARSLFVYYSHQKLVLINYPTQDELKQVFSKL